MVELNYGRMMQRAMQGLVAEALSIVAVHGLEEPHHFYITIYTAHPGVQIPDWLRAQFPKEMVIVLQYEFYNLSVGDDTFSVQLSFSNRPATLIVPFDAVLQFADPSAEFGLRFDPLDEDEDEDESIEFETRDIAATDDPDDEESGEDASAHPSRERGEAEIVNLDAFRKK